MKKFAKISTYALGTLVIVGIVFFSGIYIGYENRPAFAKVTNVINKGADIETSADFNAFWKAWNLINEKFPGAEKIDDQQRVYGAIAGLMSSLGDPYTRFFNPKDNKEFEEQISGEFSGIGVEIGMKDNVLTVIAPLKGTPAYNAGILSGDRIVKIGKTYTSELSIDAAIDLIRGEPGTKVDLTITREGVKEPKLYSIPRQKIAIPTVNTELRSDGVFVIELYSFSAQSSKLFADAVKEFANSGSRKLILDLRNNPGGYLEAAVSMAGWFLPEGEVVVKEIGKNPEDEEVLRTTGSGTFYKKIKMAILVNGGSASASEILSGALQEHGVAKLIGTKTFGKGSVQELIKLTKDTSVKITVAKWYTPNGISISGNGITPDIIVEQKQEAQGAPVVDEQFQAALKYLSQ